MQLVASIFAFDAGATFPPDIPDEERGKKQRTKLMTLMDEIVSCQIQRK